MNIDDMGHKHGGESMQYEGAVRMADGALATLVPLWRSQGYQVLVTSDHGMNATGQHGGTEPEERNVPLYVFGKSPIPSSVLENSRALSQLNLALLMCHYLGIEPSEAMLKWD
ncbi:Type I phosphodiesterase / nucleotide pyrophosphatase [compost metagenome]